MKAALLQSVCGNYGDFIDLTSSRNRSYAEKVGFDYVLHENLFDHGRHPAWNKIFSVQLLFEQGYEYVFFMDGDAVVIDSSKNIMDLVENDNILIHFCSDRADGAPIKCRPARGAPLVVYQNSLYNINSGVFLIKRHYLTKKFLKNVIDTPEISSHLNRNWEQEAIQKEIKCNLSLYSSIMKVYPFNYFNDDGDWVFHPCFPEGLDSETKKMLISKKLTK
jgi:hypothetical protein